MSVLLKHKKFHKLDFSFSHPSPGQTAGMAPAGNAVFDASGNFVLYPTLLGVKMVNLVTNQVVRVLGEWCWRDLHTAAILA